MNESTPQSDPNLTDLVDKADKAVGRIEATAQTSEDLEARRSAQRYRIKQVTTFLLVAVCIGVLYVRAPRFIHPYPVPDPVTDPEVAEATLETIASWVEVYRVSQGRYPDSLNQVNTPDSFDPTNDPLLADLVYARAGDGFTLAWTLPRWQVTFNSEQGTARIESPAK